MTQSPDRDPSEKSAGRSVADRMLMLALLLLAGTGLLFVAYQVLALTHRYSLDYGEPVMFDQALTLLHGLPLYRPNMDNPPYTVSNYPPVYVLVLAAMVKLFGPMLWTGRIISVLAGLATAVFLGLTVHALTRRRAAALVTALAFLSIPYVVQWSALARIDLLALALATAALWLLVQAPQEWRAGATGVAGATVMAG